MPLLERYKDGSKRYSCYDIPDTLAYDQRIEVDSDEFRRRCQKGDLAGAENNVRATCLITTLAPDYGWIQEANGTFVYNRFGLAPTLHSHFHRNLEHCIQADQQAIWNNLKINDGQASYVKDPKIKDAINAMSWPGQGKDGGATTELFSKFDLEDQYIAGGNYASGYHLGGGYVGTAGHCLVNNRKRNIMTSLKVVFGWFGDVEGKKFRANQVFDIESVILCDDPGTYDDPNNQAAIASWTRRWDSAIIKLKGGVSQLDALPKVVVANTPPPFGTPIYSIGHPLGTRMKVSWRSHVLRHALSVGGDSPFNHQIAGHANYSTDLDQFPGNSGGPVFDAQTGYAIGHTVSTQNGVSESTASSISDWEKRFIAGTENYKLAYEQINPYLAKIAPGNPGLKIYPKFHRTLSGNPRGGDLFQNTTFICPGDIGPNNIMLRGKDCRAIFNREHFESPDVVHRNLTGRLDRTNMFMKSMADIIKEYTGPILLVSLIGLSGNPKEPELGSRITITIGQTPWEIFLQDPETVDSTENVVMYTINVAELAGRQEIPPEILTSPIPLASWSKLLLIQPYENPPDSVRLDYLVLREPFPFSINQNWPPGRPDITANVRNLVWPEEIFHYMTTVGAGNSPTQKADLNPRLPVSWGCEGHFEWEAPIDRIWTLPEDPGSADG